MKITSKLVTHDGKYSFKDISRIDLSNLSISGIDSLDECIELNHLILSHNEINGLYGLEKCRQLWRLEINNNRIKSLDGLSRFIAMGTLNLHGNDLNWIELEKIRHLHTIDLILANNPKLDKDPYYRYHVIDCLPNVWMVDGLLVTALERLEVCNFIENSAKTTRPVRRKLPKLQFIPSDLKKRDIFGDWATKLVSKFPLNETKTLATDIRRLEFIAIWFEEIILNDCREFDDFLQTRPDLQNHIVVPYLQENFLKDLLEFRKTNKEMCNMILVLLVASLYFDVPLQFFDEMLAYTSLADISPSLETVKLFCLPHNSRIYVCNLLLSAVKIDRDQNLNAGLYDSLFNAMRILLNHSLRNLNDNQEIFIKNFKKSTNTNVSVSLRDSKYLLATEIIQLFCIVPTFYEHLFLNNGLIELLKLGVDEPLIFEAIQNFINDNISQKKNNSEISQQVGSFISNLLKLNARQQLNKKLKRKKTNETQPNTDLEAPSTASEILTQKNMSHLLTNYLIPKIEAIKRQPNVGDHLVISRRTLGKIVRFEKSDVVAFVQFENCNITELIKECVETNIENSLPVIIELFEWDPVRKFWKPEGSTGDITTFTFNGDIKRLLQRKPKEKNTIHASNSNLTSNSNNTMTTVTTIIKLNTETSKIDNENENSEETFSKAKSESDTSEKNFDTQFVKSEGDFNKENTNNKTKEHNPKTPIEKADADSLKILTANTDSNKISIISMNNKDSVLLSKEKPVNVTLDLRFKGNLNDSINLPKTPTSGTKTIINLHTSAAALQSLQSSDHSVNPQSAYCSRGFHPKKLATLRVSKSASAAINQIASNNPSLRTSKPIQSARPIRIVQTALFPKKYYKYSSDFNSEFQQKWKDESGTDEVRIMDDTQNLPDTSISSVNDPMNLKSHRQHVNNVSFDEANLMSNSHIISNVKNLHVNLPVTSENEIHENNTNLKNGNGNYSFIEPMEDKSVYDECYDKDLDRIKYTTTYDDNNLAINVMCHGSSRASKTSTPDTNKLDKNNLTEMSCLRCLTSLGYNRPFSPNTIQYNSCDACNVIKDYQDKFETFYYQTNVPKHLQKKQKKRQNIKLQDCTTWLALTNKVSYEHQYGKFNMQNNQMPNLYRNPNFVQLNGQMVLKAHQEHFPSQNSSVNSQIKNIEKINMLINRKSLRAITSPKKLSQTSPSSQAHIMCKGLRPKNANIIDPITIVSKKIELPKGIQKKEAHKLF